MAAGRSGVKLFYTVLAVAAIAGVALLAWLAARPDTTSIPVDVAIQPSDTAGFRGYLLGSDSAPVEITEYADYQCPWCQTFATLQMPTIKARLIETGRVRWRYRDFPLAQHPHARVAAHAAACADEQGKYWPMHERIYEGQQQWSSERNASGTFRDYAEGVGLDMGRYDDCMKSGRFAGRIQASALEADRVGVSSTPSLVIGNRLYRGRLDSDAIVRLVDSLAPRTSTPSTAAQ